jgi:hypothetical protein
MVWCNGVEGMVYDMVQYYGIVWYSMVGIIW